MSVPPVPPDSAAPSTRPASFVSADPSDTTSADRDDERQKLLDQLAHLREEAEALKSFLTDLPDELLESSPPQGYSTKETLGLLAASDRRVHLARLRRMVAEDEPRFEPVDEGDLVRESDWTERPVTDVLEEVREAREEVVSFLRELPAEEWERVGRTPEGDLQTVYGLAFEITQVDLVLLRSLGERMHEANLTDGEDLPK